MRRTRSYDEDLSLELQDSEFAREFIQGLIEGPDGLSLEEALRRTIQSMGIKQYVDLARTKKVLAIYESNVVDFLKRRRKPKFETINNYLKPWKLRTKIMLVDFAQSAKTKSLKSSGHQSHVKIS